MELEDLGRNIEMIALILLFIVVSVLKMVEIYLKKTKKIDSEQLDLLSEELATLKTVLTSSGSVEESKQSSPGVVVKN